MRGRSARSAKLTIRDDALWAKHIAEPAIRQLVDELRAGAPLRLCIDGHPILFRKMSDGRNGRPTPGLKVDSDDFEGRRFWSRLQARRGDTVSVVLDDRPEQDPFLGYLDEFLQEWKTPEDAAAFDDL